MATGEICIQKVDGTANKADVLTKHVTREEMERHMRWLEITVESGRHELMPRNDAKDKGGEEDESEEEEAEDPEEGEPDGEQLSGRRC